ncbi:MAG: Na+/H+ antiporter subunit G [Rickettsiaceae bacterium]|nr:Na+/H+ antiporter subunit G [Rickettsiaceae bacterium]
MIYLGWILILTGIFFITFGIIALFRFPDFYTKLHAASVIECCGIPICLLGLALLQNDYINSFRLLAIIALILILNPVSTHALGRASLLYKVDKNGRIK